MEPFLEFEKPIVSLEKKLVDLQELAKNENMALDKEIAALRKKVDSLIDETYSKLTPWQKVQLSRHPNRPYTKDYLDKLFPTFMELHGDRTYGDDAAIIGGITYWPPRRPPKEGTIPSRRDNRAKSKKVPIMIIGHQKGRTTKQKMIRNFGMAQPEGYRKAMRLMRLAEKARLPIITFIDTPGAYPDIEAEERGQSQAIAESIQLMFKLTVPVLSVVLGEGGSGGALAIGVANRILMLQYSMYSVISPEGCASILWNNAQMAEKASEQLRTSPGSLRKLKVIDGIIPEPKGGAQRNWSVAAEFLRKGLLEHMDPMIKQYHSKNGPQTIRADRKKKFRDMGSFAIRSTGKKD